MTKTRILGRALEGLEAWLYRRGYFHPEVRRLVRNQIAFSAAGSLLAILFSVFSAWGFTFAAGAWLATLNFMSLARFGQQLASPAKPKVRSLLARFYLRLILTALVLYLLIVVAGAPVVALLAGVSIVVVNFLHWAAVRSMGSKVKEA